MGRDKEDYFVLYKAPNGVYYYYVYRYGRRVKRSTGERRRAAAIAVAMDRRDRHDLLNEGKVERWQRFRDYVEPFFDWDRCPIIQDKVRRGGHYSKLMADTNRRNVQKYLVPAFGTKVLQEITPSMINTWLLGVPKRYGVKPQTASKQLTMLRQILDVAVSQGILKENPANSVKPLFAESEERGCFTSEQISQLFSEPWGDELCECACRLASLTGMRIGEVQGLRRSRIHSDHIVVDASWADHEGLKTPKNGRSRVVLIPPQFAQRLLEIPCVTDLVFSFDGDHPISRRTMLTRLHERMNLFGMDYHIGNLGFHSFRHYFNTRMVAMGIDEVKIRSVIGHGSEKMTDHYLHLSAEDLKQIRTVQEGIA